MTKKSNVEDEIKRRVQKQFWGILVAWTIVGACFSVANVNSPTASQSHLQVTSGAVALSGLLGGLFYGVLVGLPTAFAMAILELWMLRGYKVRAFQIIWAILILITFLTSNRDLGWIEHLVLLAFYGIFIATLVFNNAMKKRYADDLKKHKAPKSLILEEQEEAKKAGGPSQNEPSDEIDEEWEDDI